MNISEKNRSSAVQNLKNYIAIGLGVLAGQGLGTTYVASFLSFFYTEFMGVSAKTVGIVLAVGAIVDGISDFAMGVVIDRVQTRHGKIKHWFLWMAAPLAITTALLFLLPVESSPIFKVLWLVIVYNLYCTAVTAVRLPANTLPSVISKADKVRTTGGFVIAVVASLGSMLTNNITVPGVNALGGGMIGYRMFGVILSVVAFIACILSFIFLKEDRYGNEGENVSVGEKPQKQKEKKLTIFQQVKYLLTNKYWLIQLGMTVPFFISAGCAMGCSTYFCEYVIGDMNFFGTMMTVMMLAVIIGNVVWLPIARKLDARIVFIICGILGVGGYILGAASMFVFDHNRALYILSLWILSIGEGGISILDPMITGRVVDYGDYIHHERQEGLCFSGKSVVQKIVSAICTAVLGFALSNSGYVGGYCPPEAQTTIIILITIVPAVGYCICVACSAAFRLNGRRIEEIRGELAKRYEQD